MTTHPHTHSQPDPAFTASVPAFTGGTIQERLKAASASIKVAAAFAMDLDWLGDPASHPKASDQRDLARVRDEMDTALSGLLQELMTIGHWRAQTTRSLDLLSRMVLLLRGNGSETRDLMERREELFGEETPPEDERAPWTMIEAFAWETSMRVSVLAELVEAYPEHLQRCARQMEEWPILVSPESNPASDYHQITHLLKPAPAAKS